jgi:MYXO-CTERM domain-containing protein
MRPLLTLALALAPSVAVAAPIELVDTSESFWIFDDVDGSVEFGNFFERDPFFTAYTAIEDGFLAVHPDDSQFIVVYTTWSLPGPVGALYQATSNDVEGIGYEHIADLDPVIPAPYFDDTPNSQVQGFLHMNRWTNYIGKDPGGTDDSRISLVFGQELGHAWLAFVHVDAPAIDPRILLGRSDAHWSFYLHTNGSPVQGHTWADNGDGTFTASKTEIFEFSDLDLYLMGLIPPEEVEPFFAIVGPSDCIDSAQRDGECAPPDAFQFEAETYTVTGTRVDLTVDDVIASEGARNPAWPDTPDRYDISFILIKRPEEELGPEERAQLDTIVDRSIEIFDAQTRGLAAVRNRTHEVPPVTTGNDDDSDSEGSASDSDDTADASDTGGASNSGAATSPGMSGGLQGTETDGEAQAADPDGCGCRSDGAPRGALLVLLALAIVRRDGIPRASSRW